MPKKGYKQSEAHKRKRLENFKGELHPMWIGGRVKTSDGYIWLRAPIHPFATKKGFYVLEHRLIMEKVIKRFLSPNEVVHHINHDVSDNRLENLALLDKIEHNRLHHIGKRKGLRKEYISTFI